MRDFVSDGMRGGEMEATLWFGALSLGCRELSVLLVTVRVISILAKCRDPPIGGVWEC